MQPVQQLEGIKAADLTDDILYSEQPIVLKGLASHWPITEAGKQGFKSAREYLMSTYSGEPVIASYGAPENNGRVFYNQDFSGFNYQAAKLPLAQVLQTLAKHIDDETPPTVYMGSTDARRWFPKLLEDNQFQIPNVNPLTSVWLGNQTRIAAHFDFPTNLACNVVGRRRFTLFPPEQIENLYPGPLEFAPGGQAISLVDFNEPDYVQFPKFKQALEQAMVAELEPGDALVVPSMWWHHVEGLDPFNVLITHWWRDTPHYMGKPDHALHAAILALRSLPKEQRQAWKAIFEHYIFNDELDTQDYIPEPARDILNYPLNENSARKIRADLLNKLKR